MLIVGITKNADSQTAAQTSQRLVSFLDFSDSDYVTGTQVTSPRLTTTITYHNSNNKVLSIIGENRGIANSGE